MSESSLSRSNVWSIALLRRTPLKRLSLANPSKCGKLGRRVTKSSTFDSLGGMIRDKGRFSRPGDRPREERNLVFINVPPVKESGESVSPPHNIYMSDFVFVPPPTPF